MDILTLFISLVKVLIAISICYANTYGFYSIILASIYSIAILAHSTIYLYINRQIDAVDAFKEGLKYEPTNIVLQKNLELAQKVVSEAKNNNFFASISFMMNPTCPIKAERTHLEPGTVRKILIYIYIPYPILFYGIPFVS